MATENAFFHPALHLNQVVHSKTKNLLKKLVLTGFLVQVSICLFAQSLPTTYNWSPAHPTHIAFSQANCTSGQTSVTFTWGAVTGATGYVIRLRSELNQITEVVSAGTGTSKAILIPNGINYTWCVKATATGRTSSYPPQISEWSLTVASCPPTLSTPANGALGIQTYPATSLSWIASPGIGVVYDLYYTLHSNSATNPTLWTKKSGSTTSTTLYDLLPGMKYKWVVQAIKISANGTRLVSNYSYLRDFTTFISAPTGLYHSSPGLTFVTLNWSSVYGATAYYLQRSTNSSFPSSSTVSTQLGKTTSAYVSGLTKNTTYYWRVAAQTSATASIYSTTSSFRTGSFLSFNPFEYPNETDEPMPSDKTGFNSLSNESVRIYPNPVQVGGRFTLEGITDLSKISIFSLNGFLIFSKNNEDPDQIVFDLPRYLPKSTYILRIEDKYGKTIIKRLMVN